MQLSDLLETGSLNLGAIRWQEWISFFCQLLSVWLAGRNHVGVYPVGMVGVLLASYLYLFVAQPPLYADALLNLYFFLMSLYGWMLWVRKKNDIYQYPISYCTRSEWVWGTAWCLLSWVFIGFFLQQYTDSNTPVMDAFVSSTALTSMWWMARRKIENWPAWILSNAVAIPLNFYKGFLLFALMYVVFLLLAVYGWRQWVRSFTLNNTR